MDQSPFWEANTSAGSQYTPHVSWASNVHCRVHNSMLLVLAISQINPVHVLSKYFLKILFNITLPFAPRFSKLSLSLRVSHQTPIWNSPYVSHATNGKIWLIVYTYKQTECLIVRVDDRGEWKLQNTRQTDKRETIEGNSRSVRPERVNKWPTPC
jgi:hypothetical protein